jgi:hypothetical protein
VTLIAAGCGSDGSTKAASEPLPPPPAAAEAEPIPDDYVSDTYADGEFWHCRPDLADDVCASGLDATEVAADGSLTEMPFTPTDAPAFDCFYIYPTLDYAATAGNHSFDDPNPLEPITVRGQAARFGEQCRLFVPRYRQATIGSYEQAEDGAIFDVPAFELAYADVLDAFSHYLVNDNEGRPFVLLGHSQGSHHLVRLVQEQIDGSEALREQLVSALLVGPTGRVQVPADKVVGGSFAHLPLCTSADQTGCVVAFDSFAAELPPDYPASDDGLVPACVDPSALNGSDLRLAGGYFGPTVPGVTTPFELIEDYYTAACAEAPEGQPYLEIAADPEPGDTRELDHIDSRLETSESLHVADYNFTLGDLLSLVESQATAYGL